MYIYIIYTNLPVSDIFRLPRPRRGDSQGQETFLAPSADKQTCNYDTECIYIIKYVYLCKMRQRKDDIEIRTGNISLLP